MAQLLSRIKQYLRPGVGRIENAQLQAEVQALRSRVEQLENRLVNYYRNRWDAIDSVADYLVNAEIPGDYSEFGVFKGTTFGYAANLLHPLFSQMRFLGFDSFEGLPEPQGIDKSPKGFSSGFFQGQFASTEEDFRQNVLTAAPELSPEKLITIKGWFDRSLTPECSSKINLKKLACVWIDCDFYESTVPVLEFITPYLSVGSVILFDDWRCYRNLAEFGEQRACQEWLERNPDLKLNEFISFGFHGMSFTVAALPSTKE